LDKTIDWYLENQNWVNNVKSGEYKNWIAQNYNS
jgi:dTDP-glucose 4,6-dehydratase